MLILLEIPHKNGIVLSQMGVQANHMKPLCIRNCRSYICSHAFINKEIILYKDDYIIFFSSWDCYMGPIWATLKWANPYGTHVGSAVAQW